MSLLEILHPDEDLLYRARALPRVVVAIVSNNQDPDGLGRVRLHFPWLGDEHESAWARIAAPMAGDNRGLFFLPEIDDEVLVAFEHGDVRRPVVIGALWNGVDRPPHDNGDGENNLRILRSRSGQTITFDDSDGAEKIEIVSGANTVIIDNAANTITVSADADIVLSAAQGRITLEGQEIEIRASSSLLVGSDGAADVTAATTLTLQGGTVNIN